VLRRFVPGPGGTPVPTNGLTPNQSVNQSVTFSSTSQFVGSKLLVFVQNTDTKEVCQTASFKLSEIVAVPQKDVNELIDIYPNPAIDYLFIDSKIEIDKLIIIDMTGRIVMELKPNQERLSIPIQDFKYGMYFIKGLTQEGEFTKKFIKQQ
jgi:hypothetical protein